MSVTIGEGATFADRTNYKHSFTLNGKLSGSGILLSEAPSLSSQGDGFRGVTISGDASGFTGTWSLETVGKDNNQNGKIFGTLGSSSGSGTYAFGGVVNFATDSSATVADGRYGSVLNLAQDASIAGLKGTGGLVVGGASVNMNTLTTGAAKALTIALTGNSTHRFSGTIDSSISTLTISGSGTQAISGTINAGSVVVESGAGLDLSGATVTLGSSIQNTGVVTFSDTSVVEVGALGTLSFDTTQNGKIDFSDSQFIIATGAGSVSGLTASGIRVNGVTYANTTVADDCKSVSVSGSVYNIASGSTATISEATTAGTVDFINVLGTLTGLGSTSTSTPICGTGTVCVDTGAIEYHGMTFLETFEGVLDISGTGEVKLGSNAASKLTKVSKVAVSTGGTLSFWGSTFSKAVELLGGTLKSSGGTTGFSGSVTVTSASTLEAASGYTIAISGAVSGAGALEKTGAGTLTLTGNNSGFSGGLKATAGVVGVNNSNALGSGTLTLNGGTLQANANNLSFSNTVEVTAASGINTQRDTMTLGGAVTGTGTLTKIGTGTLKLTNASILNGTSAFGGKILVSAGTLQFDDTTDGMTISVSGGIEVANGATLYFSGTNSGYHKVTSDIVLNAGSTIQVRDAGSVTSSNAQYTFAGTVTVNPSASGVAKITTDPNNWAKEIEISGNLVGAGTLNYYRGNGDGNFNSNGRLIISGADNSQFTGKILVGGGANTLSNGLDLKANLSNATVALQASTASGANPVFMRVMKDTEVKRLEGNAGTSIGVGVANGAYTLTVGEGDFAGTIADNSYNTMAQGAGSATNSTLLVTGGVLSIVKNTTGTLTLSGNNTFSGGVTIEQGVVEATNAAALGAAANAVRIDGGQLKVSNVTLNQTAITVVLGEAYKTSAALVGENGGALATGTTVTVDATDLNALGLVAGVANEYSIWNESLETSGATLELSGAFRTLLADAGWTSSISGGTLTISAIPEPSVFGLLAGLGALALAGTRRRRRKV